MIYLNEKTILLDAKDFVTTPGANFVAKVPDSDFFTNLSQVVAWIDRNKNQMDKETLCRELSLRLRNCEKNNYNLIKQK